MVRADWLQDKSQNHRTADVGRGIWRSSGLMSLLISRGQRVLPCTVSRWLLWISKVRDSVSNLFSCSVTPTVKCYLTFNKMCFSFCPLFQLLPHKRYHMYWQTLTTQSLCLTKKLFQSLSFRHPKHFILADLFYVFYFVIAKLVFPPGQS